MEKNNIGIIAKMVTTKKIKIGLTRDNSFQSTYELWELILLEKFNNETFRSILLNTGDKYLLEFSRKAKKGSFWGGLIEDNILYGENTMGKYLMKIRDLIK